MTRMDGDPVDPTTTTCPVCHTTITACDPDNAVALHLRHDCPHPPET